MLSVERAVSAALRGLFLRAHPDFTREECVGLERVGRGLSTGPSLWDRFLFVTTVQSQFHKTLQLSTQCALSPGDADSRNTESELQN